MLTNKTKKLIGFKAAADTPPEPFDPSKNFGTPWFEWVGEIFSEVSRHFEDKSDHGRIYYRGGIGFVSIYIDGYHVDSGLLPCNSEIKYYLDNLIDGKDEEVIYDEINDELSRHGAYSEDISIEEDNSIYTLIKYSTEFKGDPNNKQDWIKSAKNAIETYNAVLGGVYRVIDEMYGINKVYEY